MGERLGQYELLTRIAMGGMAEIYRAKHLSEAGFEKDVVIKRILPQYTDDQDFVRMFLDEALLVAKLTHPNIVQVFDFKNDAGEYFLAMELVEGIDLRRLLGFAQQAGRPLGQNRAVQIALGMARGLGYAHERVFNGQPLKIVHRDVSPHNVLVSLTGDVKVMDFGIAKAAARVVKTGTGVVKGKLAYMAPEQAMGADVDNRCDIYATGLVLWEMLAGRRAFIGDNEIDLLLRVQRGAVPDLRALVPDVAPELVACLGRFLSVSLAERYVRMRDAERDLAGLLHQLGGPERAPLDAFMHEVLPEETRDAILGVTRKRETAVLAMHEAVTEPAQPETGRAAASGAASGATVLLQPDPGTPSAATLPTATPATQPAAELERTRSDSKLRVPRTELVQRPRVLWVPALVALVVIAAAVLGAAQLFRAPAEAQAITLQPAQGPGDAIAPAAVEPTAASLPEPASLPEVEAAPVVTPEATPAPREVSPPTKTRSSGADRAKKAPAASSAATPQSAAPPAREPTTATPSAAVEAVAAAPSAPTSRLELDCPNGASVYDGETVLGVIGPHNRDAFVVPAGRHKLSVRDAAGRVLGGPFSVSLEQGELDRLVCRR